MRIMQRTHERDNKRYMPAEGRGAGIKERTRRGAFLIELIRK